MEYNEKITPISNIEMLEDMLRNIPWNEPGVKYTGLLAVTKMLEKLLIFIIITVW